MILKRIPFLRLRGKGIFVKEENMKKLMAGILALSMILAMTACGETGDPTKTGSAAGGSTEAPSASVPASSETPEPSSEPGSEPAGADGEQEGLLKVFLDRNYKYDESGTLSYDFVVLDEKEAASFSALAASLESLNEETEATALEEMKGIAELTGYKSLGFYIYVLRADRNLLSLRLESTFVHDSETENKGVFAATFDTKSGKQIYPDDLITDFDKFDGVVKSKLDALSVQYSDQDLEYAEYFFGYEGVWVKLPDDEHTMVSVAYGEADVFDKRVAGAPEDWISNIGTVTGGFADVNGDGTEERIYTVSEKMDEWAEKTTVYAGDASYEIEYDGYDRNLYLVKNKGNYYVWYSTNTDNDWPNLCILDPLASGSILMGTYGLDEAEIELSDESSRELLLLDPAALVLESRTDALSTYRVANEFFVDGDGLVSIRDDIWNGRSLNALKLLTDLTVDTVDAEGNVTGTAVLKKDSYVGLCRTDYVFFYENQPEAESYWVDVLPVKEEDVEFLGDEDFTMQRLRESLDFDEADTFWRVRFEYEDWTRMINGMAEDEVFTGGMYAG